jgi:hypothetical protein
LFGDEEDADVVFFVGGEQQQQEKQQQVEAIMTSETKKLKTLSPAATVDATKFYAHRCILRKTAPMLAELAILSEDEKPTHIELPHMSPNIFDDMLSYIYGNPINFFRGRDDNGTIAYLKDIISAADKYGVINLKLEAEAYYVSYVYLDIKLSNVLEHLLFADSMNCALLKDEVMDFIVKKSNEITKEGTLKDAPSGLLNDVLAAVARKEGGTDKASHTFINELRRKAFENGLDFDGSRETLTSALMQKASDDSKQKELEEDEFD